MILMEESHGYTKSLETGFYPSMGFIDGNISIVYGVIGAAEIVKRSHCCTINYIDVYKVIEWEDFKSKLEFECKE